MRPRRMSAYMEGGWARPESVSVCPMSNAHPVYPFVTQNANGLQYHTVTTLTAEEHNIDAVNRRRAPVKRKAEGSPGRDDPEDSIHYCPYKEQLGCTRHYKHIGGVSSITLCIPQQQSMFRAHFSLHIGCTCYRRQAPPAAEPPQ